MKEFFKVTDLNALFDFKSAFAPVGTETVSLSNALGRILAQDIPAPLDLPDFRRSTMDGFAVPAASTYGASEGNPAYLVLRPPVAMGRPPDFNLNPGEAARIATGGMLPDGADSVVMVEHTDAIDDQTIEVVKSVAPGQHVVQIGEDVTKGAVLLCRGCLLRAQEIGLTAAFGMHAVSVYKSPVVGIISTGDEIVPIDQQPPPGKIRDINTHTLHAMTVAAGAVPQPLGIVKDDAGRLLALCKKAFETCDMVLLSGGSSVGMRDFTMEVLDALPNAAVLAHGISISPGKPTILADVDGKPFWGLPGHVVSAMVVFHAAVRPFIDHIAGLEPSTKRICFHRARLTRNLSSVLGRVDYVRVRLTQAEDGLAAEPILGKSGLINTMVKADGLLKIDKNTEGLDKDALVEVERI